MQPPSRESLIRYFHGQSPPHEVRLIDLYLAMDIDQAYLESCLKDAWPEIQANAVPTVDHTAREHFKQRFYVRRDALTSAPTRPRQNQYWYAAAVLLLGVCSLLFLYLRQQAPVQTYLAGTGTPTSVLLADSSEVVLFPGAKLVVSGSYNNDDRNVTLTGRAFFHVMRNAQIPFRATAGSITTQVLGTSFEINPDDFDDAYTVTLRSGKVSVVENNKQLATLAPDQQFIYNKRRQAYAVRRIDASRVTNWVTGELTYEQASLSRICHDMEKWYGVRITIDNAALRAKKITTSFSHEPIGKVLDVLSETSGLQYEIQGDRVTIR